eukprot:g1784.t1
MGGDALGNVVTDFRTLVDSMRDQTIHWKQQKKFLCFDNLVTGFYGGAFATFRGHTAHPKSETGLQLRESHLFDYRQHFFQSYKVNPHIEPLTHHILILDKKKTGWNHGAKGFANTNDLVQWIHERYGHDVNVTVESAIHKLPMTDQLKLYQSATILISPWGGISVPSIFLSRGSTLIVTANTPHLGVFPPEYNVWRHTGWLQVLYYWWNRSFDECKVVPASFQSEFEKLGIQNASLDVFRDHCSVVIQKARFLKLMDAAFLRQATKHESLTGMELQKLKENFAFVLPFTIENQTTSNMINWTGNNIGSTSLHDIKNVIKERFEKQYSERLKREQERSKLFLHFPKIFIFILYFSLI